MSAERPSDPHAAQGRDGHGKGAWYFVSVWFCVLCGHTDVTPERRWDDKPADPTQRGDYTEGACGVHFS